MRVDTGWIRRGGAVVAGVAVVAACGTAGDGGAGKSGGGDVQPTTDTFTSNAAGAVAPCAQVKVAVGEPKPSEAGDTQMRLPLTMTNVGGAVCVLRGFPGAVLKGPDDRPWDLRRSADEVKDVRLEPKASTTAYLTYLPEKGERQWDVTALVVTPPNTDDSQTLDWPGGPVLLQDAATRPGSYIGPVGAWGSGGA